MSSPLKSRSNGRSTVSLKPQTEKVRTCSHSDHRNRKASYVRVVKGTRPSYLAFYPQCSECAARKFPKALGLTEELRPL